MIDLDIVHKLVTVFHGTLNHPHFKHINDWAHEELMKMKVRDEPEEEQPRSPTARRFGASPIKENDQHGEK